MHNASCTGVNSVCQLLEGEVIDAALSICHLIMPPQQILNRGAVIKYVDLLEFTTTWLTITFWLTYIQVQWLETFLNATNYLLKHVPS